MELRYSDLCGCFVLSVTHHQFKCLLRALLVGTAYPLRVTLLTKEKNTLSTFREGRSNGGKIAIFYLQGEKKVLSLGTWSSLWVCFELKGWLSSKTCSTSPFLLPICQTPPVRSAECWDMLCWVVLWRSGGRSISGASSPYSARVKVQVIPSGLLLPVVLHIFSNS